MHHRKMEFACSHVVCNWKPDGKGSLPPPLPPRRLKKNQSTSLPLASPDTYQSPLSVPSPQVPPRIPEQKMDCRVNANVNIVSIQVGNLVDISNRDSETETLQTPVLCGKCTAALSCLSSTDNDVWKCEFCGCENGVDPVFSTVCIGQRSGVHTDDLYLPDPSTDDYQNLEDSIVVFCVDISGSMSITTEISTGSGSSVHISRLESIQDALRGTLTSILQQSPRRRVALITFNDEVVIYGDGAGPPLTLTDWALLDYDHIWNVGVAFNVPHCIAETSSQLLKRINQLVENGATSLGPAALASVAMASRYPGSKVILCTDGRANIGLGQMEESSSLSFSPPYFYRQLAQEAVGKGVIISVMTFKGTDCSLADIGRLADATGGRVNIVTIGTVATQIQSVCRDNVLATGVTATIHAPDGVYFPFEEESNHKLVREIGNVTKGQEMTFQFAVKPDFTADFLQRGTLPFQLQLRFRTRDQQDVTRIITEQRPVTTSSQILVSSLKMAVLSVHCVQLSASLTMQGRVQEAQKQLKEQNNLLKQLRLRPIEKDESIYSNWMETMTTICDKVTEQSESLSDEAAEVVYQMKRASSFRKSDFKSTVEIQKQEAIMEAVS